MLMFTPAGEWGLSPVRPTPCTEFTLKKAEDANSARNPPPITISPANYQFPCQLIQIGAFK